MKDKNRVIFKELLATRTTESVSPIEQDIRCIAAVHEFRVSREMIQKQLRELRKNCSKIVKNLRKTQHTQTKRQETARKKRPLTQVEKAEQILLYPRI